MVEKKNTHAERYDKIDLIQDLIDPTKHFPLPTSTPLHPPPIPGSSLCTELWGILGGFCSRKGPWCYFSENLLWMFITFQVSVAKEKKTFKKKQKNNLSTTLLSTRLSFPPPPIIFSNFLFLSTESCDILCIFKQLIRVFSSLVFLRFRVLSSSSMLPSFSPLLFEKELLPKETCFGFVFVL